MSLRKEVKWNRKLAIELFIEIAVVRSLLIQQLSNNNSEQHKLDLILRD